MTSPIEEIEVGCPECGHLFKDWYRPSVNLELDDFDDEYLEHFSSAVCPKCKFKIQFGALTVRNGEFYFEDRKQIENELRETSFEEE